MSALANELSKALDIESNKTFTLNGMEINHSSLDPVVDLFFSFGSNRGSSKAVNALFRQAFASNVDLAVRVALYGRDVRGGMGEREHFRTILSDLARSGQKKVVVKLIPLIPVIGRWDDLFSLVDTPAEREALEFYAAALQDGHALAAKWCPREKSAHSHWAKKLREFMGLSPKMYRKLLVSLTNVVENKMCANEWSSIDYNTVPSLASIRYQRAFERNDLSRYTSYIKALESGEAKVNAGAVYPYQVIQSLFTGNSRVAEQQWKALPNYIPEGKSFLPMVDVSGSMGCSVPNSNVSAMDIAISLGLYCSMKAKGPFENKMMSFSERPTWIDVTGLSLQDAVSKTRYADWGMNTNILAAYEMILDAAVKHNVPQSDMPDYFIVFSDMQFDSAVRGSNDINSNLMEKFEEAGYQMPKMVYWNLVDYGSNTPVEFDSVGSALVSGFSPTTMKAILSDVESFTPINVVLEAVMQDRYNWNQ